MTNITEIAKKLSEKISNVETRKNPWSKVIAPFS